MNKMKKLVDKVVLVMDIIINIVIILFHMFLSGAIFYLGIKYDSLFYFLLGLSLCMITVGQIYIKFLWDKVR